jgi:serine/threonine protein kinase
MIRVRPQKKREQLMTNDDRASLPAGTLVANRFEILEEAGRGSFGLTYRARDAGAGKMVALKEYFPLGDAMRSSDGNALSFKAQKERPDLASFEKEAKALDGCPNHPGIATFIAADLANNTGYLALEWIEGSTLGKLGDTSDAYLRAIFLQLVEAILHLDDANLAHRDIKPDNIMIRADGSAVLVDLGAARLVAGGATFDTKSVILSPAFAGPEQYSAHGYQGVWTDLFGLSATFYTLVTGCSPVSYRSTDGFIEFVGLKPPLRIRQLNGEASLANRDHRLLDAIDLALTTALSDRPSGGRIYLETMGIHPTDLADYLPPKFLAQSVLEREDKPRPHELPSASIHLPTPEGKTPIFRKHQSAIIQSLDSARFQNSSFLTSDGFKQDNTPDQKVALARTEVLLNLMFGREVVIPAGHIADSPAVFAIVGEILKIYQDEYQFRIDAAFKRENMPLWRPFRLAMDDPANRDGYRGFVERYHYTGASLPLLQAAGRDDGIDFEQAKAQGVEAVRGLFLGRKYDALEKAVRQDGYGLYAARIDRYFSDETSVFAVDPRPIEAMASYADVFFKHLDNDYVSGNGVSEAKASLSMVEKIKSDLAQLIEHGVDGATGFRGNWYVYAEQFKHVWPLARGYLDAKLYLSLAQKYGIDHPILVSQALEYGSFDHSLILGPRFGASIIEQPKLDSGLSDLAQSLAGPLPWHEVFEAFLDRDFLISLRLLNQAFEGGDLDAYRLMIRQHARLVDDLISIVNVNLRSGEVAIEAGDASNARVAFSTYEPLIVAGQRGAELRLVGESILPPYGVDRFNAADASIVPLRAGLQDIGKRNPALIHYFVKPLKLRILA